MDAQAKKMLDATSKIIEELHGDPRQIEIMERGVASGNIDPEKYLAEISEIKDAFLRIWGKIVSLYVMNGKQAIPLLKTCEKHGLSDALFDFAETIFACAYHEGYENRK